MMGSRLTHVRELKAQVDKLTEENHTLRDELGALKAHLDLAMLALADLQAGEELEIWDGWNLILSADKVAKSREELLAQAKASGKRVWIVYDGHDENVKVDGKVRISYTGGKGEQRADKFICAFLRCVKYLGVDNKITLRTFDKALLASTSTRG